MHKQFRLWVMAFALATGQAFGAFHLWTMTELYSNADGSVQFLELRAVTGGQQFLGDHSLSTSSGGVTREFTFPNGLPGDTTNRSMLIGTQGFAALGIVTPNYIVPNGFFFKGGGRISFAENSDVWDHGPIPDGVLSLNRNGSTGTNSPLNFAGQSGTITSAPLTSFNVHGLWWNDPDGSEPGWGVNLSHHGNIIFVSWFTYDIDGSAMWLFMSNAAQTGPNTYSGEIYRATGASFDAYDPSRFAAPSVGTGTLTFSSAGQGQFNYRVNSGNQTKAIKRYIFGSLPTCDQGGSAGTNFTDLWGNTSEPGWGVNVVQQDNTIFASWFTYGSDGRGSWLYASGMNRTTGNTFTGELFRAATGPAYNTGTWNAGLVTAPQVGTATLNFTGTSNATFTYSVGAVSQTKSIARNVHAAPATTCR
jgi:hypothetical protein